MTDNSKRTGAAIEAHYQFLAWLVPTIEKTRTASGVAAMFILCNSIARLLGNVAIVKALPTDLPIYAPRALRNLTFLGTTGQQHAKC
jgi:hypothetical protein